MTTRARVKTGERRKADQPFHIDRLPAAAQDAILWLKNTRGKTLEEIVAQSAEKYNEAWKSKGGGFIEWDKLAPAVRKLFPKKTLVLSSLHRWYDVRFRQVRADVMAKSEQARILAESFAKSMLVNGNEAVVNAARDTIMGMLAEDSSESGRQAASAGLIALAEVMQRARANDIRERKVSTEERKIKLLEDRERLQREKLEQAAKDLERKRSTGKMTRADIEKLVETTFGLPAKAA
jgi:hypothetical protein